MSRKKIVFVIDVESTTSSQQDICAQIHFSVLRILTYYGGKHRWGNKSEKHGPLWGFKFYSSAGSKLIYKKQNFFDLRMDDFESFETRLKDNMKAKENMENSIANKESMIYYLSCALTEVVSEFQWERPDFFSPQKSKGRNAGKSDKINKESCSLRPNSIFLFTSCPYCHKESNFSENEYLKSAEDLKKVIMKDELFQKLICTNNISLNWIDTGQESNKKIDGFHNLLSETMKLFGGGALIPLKILSSWWRADHALKTPRKFWQPVPFCSLMHYLLQNSDVMLDITENNKIRNQTDPMYLSLQFPNDTFTLGDESKNNYAVPLMLRATSVEGYQRFCSQQDATFVRGIELQDSVNPIWFSNGLENNSKTGHEIIARIKGVLSPSSTLLMLQDMHESFYCSYRSDNLSQSKEKDSAAMMVYQQLLSILLEQKLLLILELCRPNFGFNVHACLQPWTDKSAVITIFSPGFGLMSSVSKECNVTDNLLHMIKMKVKNLQEALVNVAHVNCKSSSPEGTIANHLDDLHIQANNGVSSSFIQSMDPWFYDLPTRSLPKNLHNKLKRLQADSAHCPQRIHQQSSLLLSKLKDCYKQQHKTVSTPTAERNAQTKRVVLKSPHVKSRSITYSQKLIARSKAVHARQKSNESIKEKEKELNWKLSDKNKTELKNDNEDNVFLGHDVNAIPNGKDVLSFQNVEELTTYLKTEISAVLQQENTEACEHASIRISKILVQGLQMINDNKDAYEVINPESYLDQLFSDLEKPNRDEKKIVRVSRYIFHVLLLLEVAVLFKTTTSSSKIAEKAVRLFRPVMFLEDPGYVANYLNKIILIKFRTKIPYIIREIFEGLAQDPPNELLTPSKRLDEDESFEGSDLESVINSDYDSIYPSSQSVRRFRRFSSINESMNNKRQIAIPKKKNDRGKSKKRDSQEFSKEQTREGWCRNLFDNETDVPVKGSKKRKLTRRYSELVTSVKDTPVCKQRRHSLWKRQHKERKKTEGITNITVIEESPLKGLVESPSKFTASKKNFCRSQSFSYQTSPKRFYSFRRNQSILTAKKNLSNRSTFYRATSCITNLNRCIADSSSENQLEWTMELQDRSKDAENESIFCRSKSFSCNITPVKEQIFVSNTPEKATSTEFPTSMWGRSEGISNTDDSLAPPNKCLQPFNPRIPKPFLNSSSKFEATEMAASRRYAGQPFTYSEDSMDWVRMFEHDQPTSSTNGDLAASPCAPLSLLAGTEKDMNISPNIFTPVRDSKKQFTSPYLSASSLETLENAPILSPRMTKSKRNTSCRKRIDVPAE